MGDRAFVLLSNSRHGGRSSICMSRTGVASRVNLYYIATVARVTFGKV